MKTMKTTLFILAAFLISGVASATGNLNVNFKAVSAGTAIIEISNVNETTFEIDIHDDKGEVLFYKKTSEPALDYKKLYDFSVLEDGNYYMNIKIENEQIEKFLTIENGKIELVGKKKSATPFFAYSNDILKLSYLNFGENDMNIYVYDNNNKLYEKTLEPGFAVHKALDFSKLRSGIYDVVFASGEALYEYQVVKK